MIHRTWRICFSAGRQSQHRQGARPHRAALDPRPRRRGDRVNRRELIALIGCAAVGRPLPVPAQQAGRKWRIGVLLGVSASDPEYQRRITVLGEALRELGWMDETTAFELRFAEGKLDRLPKLATELVQAKVDVIVTQGTEVTDAA